MANRLTQATRRGADVAAAAAALVLVTPLLGVAALAIKVASPGPVLYRAHRVGLNGRQFTMYKLRTMRHAPHRPGRPLTAADDPRVFPVGRLLRYTKIDELPQLVNVIRGDMAIVGPRPEAPTYVEQYYGPDHRETLAVRPGLVSPGTLYYYTQAERALVGDDAHRAYVERVLPHKLALDLAYFREQSFWSDLRLIGRTLIILTQSIARGSRAGGAAAAAAGPVLAGPRAGAR